MTQSLGDAALIFAVAYAVSTLFEMALTLFMISRDSPE